MLTLTPPPLLLLIIIIIIIIRILEEEGKTKVHPWIRPLQLIRFKAAGGLEPMSSVTG